MRCVFISLLVITVAAFLAVAPVLAHHVIAAKFDPARSVTLNGTVTGIDWLNPHVHIFMDVQDGNTFTNWAIELESQLDLQRNGWTRDTLKPGDAITVQGITARDGSKQAWGNSVVVTNGGRRVFAVTAAPPRRDNAAARPAPRGPDGKPRLSAMPGERGYWGNPSAALLMQNGANVQADADGLLRNIADVDKVAPFQRWARDLFELRQRSFLKDDPMFLFCKPQGGPRQFQSRHGIQFLEEPDQKRILVLLGGGNRNWRYFYLDGRPQLGPAADDPEKPVYFGRTAARWEGDTLVVDTKKFNEEFWFTNGGLPHTDQLHLIERISRPDFNTLKYEVTIDDPGAYTRTWNGGWTLQWIPGEEPPEYLCQDNRP
jgi:hypothetical protein